MSRDFLSLYFVRKNYAKISVLLLISCENASFVSIILLLCQPYTMLQIGYKKLRVLYLIHFDYPFSGKNAWIFSDQMPDLRNCVIDFFYPKG